MDSQNTDPADAANPGNPDNSVNAVNAANADNSVNAADAANPGNPDNSVNSDISFLHLHIPAKIPIFLIMMNRRELLQRAALMVGGTLVGADSLLAKNIDWDAFDADAGKGSGIFYKTQVRLMNEIAETIIPATDTPGAKAAKTGQFMAVIVSDCYDAEKQKRFLDGLVQVDAECKTKHGKTFLKCSPAQRHAVLDTLDKAQFAYYKTKKKEDPDHYFRVIKDLVLWGYFTSEIGATQALRFVEYPGKYTTIDYKKGDRAWGG